ncbi:MAG TPA: hypothetical protein VGZ52_10850 [Acidimicrobiales bacterium]|nr:hypothetical protein [Acidimicrobiales bacterium]
MIPNVSQQLGAIRNTIAKVVVPAVDPDNGFAQEQAGLVLASLDWVIDVVAHEQHYEQLEHREVRALVTDLLALDPAQGADEARAAIDASAEPPADLLALRAQSIELKRCADLLFGALTATPDTPGRTESRRLLTAASRRQIERERSWTRMTGFSGAVPNVGEVLAQQELALA